MGYMDIVEQGYFFCAQEPEVFSESSGFLILCGYNPQSRCSRVTKGVAMKARHRFMIGFTALVMTVIGTLTGCPPEAKNEPWPVLTGAVTVATPSSNGVVTVGHELSADTSRLEGTSDGLSFNWKRGGSLGSIGSGRTYTVQPSDAGQAVYVEVRRNGYTGTVTSDITTPVVPVNGGFVPVANIYGIPSTIIGASGPGVAFTKTEVLDPIVEPAGATNKRISWSVTYPTPPPFNFIGNSNTLTATAPGTIIVTATIANGIAAQGANFTKDFAITVIDSYPGSGNADITITVPGANGISEDNIEVPSPITRPGTFEIKAINAPPTTPSTPLTGIDEGSYRWFIDGVQQPGNSDECTVDAGRLTSGGHSVMLIVTKGGVTYSARKPFTVPNS